MHRTLRGLTAFFLGALGLVTLVAPVANSQSIAPTFSVLYGFHLNYLDGYQIRAPVIQASDGNLYGTTVGGGNDGQKCSVHFCGGTVFKLTLKGEFTSLHTFGWPYDGGAKPSGGLAEGPDGYLYGTTSEGGATGAGVVYKISKTGQFQKLHDFCQPRALCRTEGETPTSGLIAGRDGNLYGKTSWAGGGGGGTIFRISPSGDFATIFAFNETTGGAGQNGLVQASDGNFYGSNVVGIWRVTPSGQGTQLYRFNARLDGSGESELIQAKDGNLYGVTYSPGAVYRISLSGSYKQIHLLSPAAEGGGNTNTLVQTTDGNLWGSTTGSNGGVAGVFTITTDGSLVQSTFLDSRKTGAPSLAPLIQASDGKLYGTTYGAGSTPDGQPANGTVFVIDSTGGPRQAPVAESPAPASPDVAPPVLESPAPATPDVAPQVPVDSAPPPAAAPDLLPAEAVAVPDALTDSVRADVVAAIDRCNAAWANALQTLDGSTLSNSVTGQLLTDNLAALDRLRAQGLSQTNINTDFTVVDMTLTAPGYAVVQTQETWEFQISSLATGQPVRPSATATYVETYVVEFHNGGWIVSQDELTPQ